MRDAEKTVGNMIDKLKTAFIGSIDNEGFPNIKAMLQPRKREGIKTVYLTTNTSSMRVAQYRENNHACIYFCDARFFRGVMLRGTMEVLADSASKEMIWQEGDTMYYPIISFYFILSFRTEPILIKQITFFYRFSRISF